MDLESVRSHRKQNILGKRANVSKFKQVEMFIGNK